MYIFTETDGFFMILLRERDLDREDEMYSRSSILISKDFLKSMWTDDLERLVKI